MEGWGHLQPSSPASNRKGHLDSPPFQQLGLPLHAKVKLRGHKAREWVTTSRPAPGFPGKPFSRFSGPGLTRRCRSVAERPPRCAALHPAMRRGACREPLRGWGRGARARSSGRLLTRPRHPRPQQQPLSRDFRATSRAAPLALARSKAWPPGTLQELSEVLSSQARPDQLVGGHGEDKSVQRTRTWRKRPRDGSPVPAARASASKSVKWGE